MVKNCLQFARPGSTPGIGRSPGGGAWQPAPVFLPGESYGQRSLAGYSPWGRKESDTTEQLNNNNKALDKSCMHE